MHVNFQVMLHLSHPSDKVVVQVLGFLRAILYLGNPCAQEKIGHLCNDKDSKFIQKIHKMLGNVISIAGHSEPIEESSTRGHQFISSSNWVSHTLAI